MKSNPYLKDRLEEIEVSRKSISELLRAMSKTGFQGRKIGEVVDAWESMLQDEEVTIFMGLAGSLCTTGMPKILMWLIENRFIDVLVSTGANVSEDILSGMGASYWKGHPLVDDEDLFMHKVERFYDVFASEDDYVRMEELISEFIASLRGDYIYSSADFLHLFGRELSGRGVRSLVTSAYRAKVPVFSPALFDSAYGVGAMLALARGHRIIVDQFKDFEQLTEIVRRSAATAVVFIGGGVPKDTIQLLVVILSLLEEKKTGVREAKAHRYAVQVTTDSPQWGGLSGATLEEAISWGKTSRFGVNVTLYCDATIALPLIVHALDERVNRRKAPKDFSWLFSELE